MSIKLEYALIFLVGVTLQTGCAATQKSSEDSEILGVTKANGIGAPYGKTNAIDESSNSLKQSTDESYGYTKENPIKVGGIINGPRNERNYLSSLTGPKGETIYFERLGSCCPFETPNGIMGGGLLDVFKITYKGMAIPIKLYINIYDEGELLVPVGLTER